MPYRRRDVGLEELRHGSAATAGRSDHAGFDRHVRVHHPRADAAGSAAARPLRTATSHADAPPDSRCSPRISAPSRSCDNIVDNSVPTAELSIAPRFADRDPEVRTRTTRSTLRRRASAPGDANGRGRIDGETAPGMNLEVKMRNAGGVAGVAVVADDVTLVHTTAGALVLARGVRSSTDCRCRPRARRRCRRDGSV